MRDCMLRVLAHKPMLRRPGQGVGTAAGKETSHCEPPRPSAATQTLAVAPRHPAALQRSLDCPWHTSRAEIVPCEVSQSTVVRGTVKLRQPILSSA